MKPHHESIEGRGDADRQQIFVELMRQYQDQIFNDIAFAVGKLSDAERILEQSFLEVYQKFAQGKENNRSVLIQILKAALDHIQATEFSNGEPMEQLVTAQLTSEQRTMMRALWKLTLEERSFIVLREIENLSYEELSRIFGLNHEQILSEVCRIRLKLLTLVHEEDAKRSEESDAGESPNSWPR